MNNEADVKEINERYRAYCDACQSGQLEQVPTFWSLPALFRARYRKAGNLATSAERAGGDDQAVQHAVRVLNRRR